MHPVAGAQGSEAERSLDVVSGDGDGGRRAIWVGEGAGGGLQDAVAGFRDAGEVHELLRDGQGVLPFLPAEESHLPDRDLDGHAAEGDASGTAREHGVEVMEARAVRVDIGLQEGGFPFEEEQARLAAQCPKRLQLKDDGAGCAGAGLGEVGGGLDGAEELAGAFASPRMAVATDGFSSLSWGRIVWRMRLRVAASSAFVSSSRYSMPAASQTATVAARGSVSRGRMSFREGMPGSGAVGSMPRMPRTPLPRTRW